MHFETISDALFMDGHGLYVWAAYILSVLPIVLMIWLPILRMKRYWRWIDEEQSRRGLIANVINTKHTPREDL